MAYSAEALFLTKDMPPKETSMAQNKFKGLGVALVTPFNSDGSIDWDALFRLVEYQISRGIDFLCVMGTTAETPTLTSEEKKLWDQFLRNYDIRFSRQNKYPLASSM